MMDSVPVVFFTGQVRTDLLGTDGFQEADTFGITMPIVKHSFMIQHPTEIPRVVHEAFHIARTGRPGPVLIDMPTDLTRVEIDYEPVGDVRLPGYQPTTEGNQKQIRLAAKAMANARRPVLYAGGGVINANASEELTALARVDRLPVTCTLMGLGAFPAPDEQWLGMLGMHGTRTANYAMDEADLIVAVGARFDDRITGKLSEFAPRAKFIHIDIDPAEISKNVPAHIPIVGDAKNILARLIDGVPRAEPRPGAAGGVVGADRALARPVPAALRRLRPTRRSSRSTSSRRSTRPRTRATASSRPTSASTRCGRRSTSTSTSRGAGSSRAASGRWASACRRRWAPQVAQPDMQTVVLSGDASIQMNMQELSTLATYGIPVKVVIMNNGFLGMVRQWQELFWDRRYSARRDEPVAGLRQARRGDGLPRRAARRTRRRWSTTCARRSPSTGPVVIDARVTKEESVYPMIAPGQAARNMVG